MHKLNLFNKTDWSEGPWQTESDVVRWIDVLTHLPCFILRDDTTGAWCGYVGVSYTHEIYRVPYSDPTYNFIDVHGGVSFAGYLPLQDRWVTPAQKWWWIGFDCAQEFDQLPLKLKNTDDIRVEYRDEEYVRLEVAVMAQQLQLMVPYDDWKL